jgi:DNA helicase-2/ATP-dependent DNA helicase PcrA
MRFDLQLLPTDRLREFHRLWTLFKQETGSIDFTDMIEMGLRGPERAPDNPKVGFFDETQDFSALELALVRRWGAHMERLVLAGDDDQSIYWFKGATPEAFLDPPLPPENYRVLGQSFRVPRVIQELASNWIAGVERRHPKEYRPRDSEGSIMRMPENVHYRDPAGIIPEVEAALSAGQTVQILASCGYMLVAAVKRLREAGIPFHNPYRKRNGLWNPLAAHGRGRARTSSADRLLAFLKPTLAGELWTGRELHKWVSAICAPDVMPRGAKTKVEELSESDSLLTLDEVHPLFLKEQLPRIYGGDLTWFEDRLLGSKAPAMALPMAIYRNRGRAALEQSPSVVVGTIHSVKGTEADVVILFPDISQAAAWHWSRTGSGHDSIIRTFYVGMTRARERLVICARGGNNAVL